MPILLILLAGGLYYLYTNSAVKAATSDTNFAPKNSMNLLDISPPDQGGSYDQSYDYSFVQARDKWGVPWALLKAHAIAESSLDSSAFRQEPNGKASYGLMQILWWPGSNRFNNYGVNDDRIGDGSLLYDPDTNVDIAAQLIRANWGACSGNLRDTINMYNTGVKESVRAAPYDYVNKVLQYYKNLIGRDIPNV